MAILGINTILYNEFSIAVVIIIIRIMDHNNDYCYWYCYTLVLWHFLCQFYYSIRYHRNSTIIIL